MAQWRNEQYAFFAQAKIKMTETLQHKNTVVTIVRSPRRKTISLQIKSAQIFILVPQALSKAEIERVLTKKNRWIEEKLHLQQQIGAIEAKQFISGEIFSCLGQDYPLEITQGSAPRIQLYQNQLIAVVRNKQVDNSLLIKKMLISWYQNQAQIKLLEKTQHYAKIIGVRPCSIVVKTFKARWGSCSAKNEIHYNWKIIMATDEVVNYVVVHELCHILHHNHSPQFWQAVERYWPTYRLCKQWLKLNGKRLEI